MKRTIFDDQHQDFRSMFRNFLEREVVPEFPKWEEQGYAPHEFYRKLGALGVMGFDIPVEYGGTGPTSYKYITIMTEEAALAGVSLGNYGVTTGIVLPTCSCSQTTSRRNAGCPAAPPARRFSRSR